MQNDVRKLDSLVSYIRNDVRKSDWFGVIHHTK